jgi:hypothetical protein
MFVSEMVDKAPVAWSFGMRLGLALTGIGTLLIGVYPEPFLQLARASTTLIR